MGNTPASLLPDFRPGSGVMGVRVIGIIELIEQLSFAAIRPFQAPDRVRLPCPVLW